MSTTKNQKNQPQEPPNYPQHVTIGLNAFNSTSKISNANWETNLLTPVVVNNGDSIVVKNAYIDTRLQTSQNIIIEEDIVLEMEYYFYYVNRGGTNLASADQDYGIVKPQGSAQPTYTPNPYITQQMRVNELGLIATIPAAGTTETAFTEGWNVPFDIIDSTVSPNEQTISNMAQVIESIYYCPTNIGESIYNTSYTTQQKRNNPMAYIMPQGINAADGLPYLLTTVTPNVEYGGGGTFSIGAVGGNIVDEFNPYCKWLYAKTLIPVSPGTPANWNAILAQLFEFIIGVDLNTGKYVFNSLPGEISSSFAVGVAGLPTADTIITIDGSFLGGVTKVNDAVIQVPLEGWEFNQGDQNQSDSYEIFPPDLTITGFGVSSPPPVNPFLKSPDKIVPFTKKWTFNLPAGAYSPDYLAEVVSRGMSIQKTKIQRDYIGNNPQGDPVMNTLTTPVNLINGQAPTPELTIQNGTLPDIPTGPFSLGTNYQPSLMYASKNPNSYPNAETGLGYSNAPYEGDFNDPYGIKSKDYDDMPFMFRPNAFTNAFGYTKTECGFNMQFVTGAYLPGIVQDGGGVPQQPVVNVRLALNDGNMQLYNDMPNSGTAAGNVDRTIDMAYTSFLQDVTSPFYYVANQDFAVFADSTNPPTNGGTPTNTIPMNNASNGSVYGIRPIYSTMQIMTPPVTVIKSGVVESITSPPCTWTTTDISSPLVGAPEMSLVWNAENSNVFSLPYLHTPIYNKPDPTTNQVQESIAKYPSNYALTYQPTFLRQGMIQCNMQSGIIMKSMTAKTRGGEPFDFWQGKLGFDVKGICARTDASGNVLMTYREFIKKTTGGFSGSANIYNPAPSVYGSGEQCYAAVEDLYNFSGWYNSVKTDPFSIGLVSQKYFLKNIAPVFYTCSTTTAINALSAPLDANECGHILVEIQAWNLPFITQTDFKEIKAIVSSYYVSQNSFVSLPNSEVFTYYHYGPTMTISNLKVRLLSAKTMQELPLIGPNSSVYVMFIKNNTLQNIETSNEL